MKKIKILHVIGIMNYGGAETMIMNLYRKIDRQNFQFDFLVHRPMVGDFDQEIMSYGGKIYHLPEYKIYNFLHYRRECQRFFEMHADYDIVHGHIESCAPIYLKEAQKVGIYTIAHCHSTGYQNVFLKFAYNILTYRTRGVAEFFFACSRQAGINRYGKKVVESKRFKIFNNGIETKKYIFSYEKQKKMKKEWGVEGQKVIGHVGRMAKEKNQIFLIKAFSQLCLMDRNVILVLVGDGTERKRNEDFAKALGIEDKVIFTGTRRDVPDLMNLFDLFVFPSIYEGLGIALIEAQASGLPCIVSDSIVDEAILTQNVVRMSLNQSAKNWANEMENQLKKNDKRENRFSEICKSGFDINETVEELETFYKTCCLKEHE